jgi:hypothetical protein
LGKTIALRFEIVRFLKKPALYALKTLNFKLTLPSLGQNTCKTLPSLGSTYTANEGLVRIQYKCLVPIYVFPEMKLRSLVISKTKL